MNRDVCEHFTPIDLHCDHCADKRNMTRYISNDTAKCMGNPEHKECDDCLRRTLPVHPDSYRQWWQGVWISNAPCPFRWFEPAESRPDWSAA